MESDDVENLQKSLVAELRRGNELTIQLIRNQRDWKLALRQGLLAGFGGVVGATLLVSLLITVLKPFEQLTVLKPALERIAESLERKPGR